MLRTIGELEKDNKRLRLINYSLRVSRKVTQPLWHHIKRLSSLLSGDWKRLRVKSRTQLL